MKVLFLLLLLPLLGCQEASRAPSTATGSTVSAPKSGKTSTPKKSTKNPNPETPDIYKVPAELAKYVDTFYAKMGTAGLNNYRRNVIMLMDPDMNRAWAGTCTYATDSNLAVIKISTYWWYNSDYVRRESVMYHELGHCVLNRGHNSSVNSFNRAKSIMSTGGLPYDDEYEDYYPEYMAELFRVSPTKFATTKFSAYIYYDTNYKSSSTSAYRVDYVSVLPPNSDTPPDVECGSH